MANYARPPRLDPADWWDYLVFRETFLAEVQGEEEVAVIREFGKVFNAMAHEVVGGWHGTFADVRAHSLRAVLADLRHLQGYLGYKCAIEEDQEQSITPRHRRWCEFGLRLSEQLGALAEELEEELSAGLATPDA